MPTKLSRNLTRRAAQAFGTFSKRVRRLRPVEWLTRLLFGDDVFISYSRRGGIRYAEQLAYRLSEEYGYSCRVDLWETLPGQRVPKKLLRALCRSRMLVLVSSKWAMESANVGREIKFYKRTHSGDMHIVPVDFGGTVRRAAWFKLIDGLPPGPRERPAALQSGTPSGQVVKRIGESFGFTRRNRRLFWASVGSLVVFLTLLALSGSAAVYAGLKLDEATEAQMEAAVATTEAYIRLEEAADSAEEARVQTRLAADATRNAEYQTLVAEHRRKEAETQTRLAAAANRDREAAERLTREARRLEEEARANAAEQQKIAGSRQLAAQSSAQLDEQFDLSLRFAAEAYEVSPTLEARRSLLTAFAEHPYLARVLRGHSTAVADLALTPDGRTLITRALNGELVFWDLGGKGPPARYDIPRNELPPAAVLLAELPPEGIHTGPTLTPDGKKLVTTGNGKAALWDVASQTQSPLAGAAGNAFYFFAAAHPDGQTVLMGEAAGEFVFWDVARNAELHRFAYRKDGDNAMALCAAFGGEGGRALVAGSANGDLWLWDVTDLKNPGPRIKLEAHQRGVRKVVFSPDGQRFASLDEGGDALVWDAKTLQRKPARQRAAHENSRGDGQDNKAADSAILDFAFSPNGRFLAVARDDGEVQTLDLDSADPVAKTIGQYVLPVIGVTFSPDSRFVISGNVDGTITAWDFPWPLGVAREPPGFAGEIPGHSGPVLSTAFTADGTLMASGDKEGSIMFTDLSGGRASVVIPDAHRSPVSSLAFHPTRKVLASGGDDGQLKLWEAQRDEWQGVELPVAEATPPPLRMRSQGPTPPAYGGVAFVSFADEGGKLITLGPGSQVVVWDMVTKRPTLKISLPTGGPNGWPLPFSAAAVSRDGKVVIGFEGGELYFLDVNDDEPGLRPMAGHGRLVEAAAFSHDGRLLATIDSGGNGILWAAGSPPLKCAEFQPLPYTPELVGPDAIGAITFGRQDKVLAIATRQKDDKQGGIVLWDVEARSTIGTLPTQRGGWSLSFRPDGKSVATGGKGAVVLLDADPASWAARARRMLEGGPGVQAGRRPPSDEEATRCHATRQRVARR